MLKALFTSCFFVLLTIAGYGNVKPVAKHPVAMLRRDSSKMSLRSFNSDTLQQYANNKDFQYNDDAIPGHTSLWHRFWHWFWHFITNLFSSTTDKWQLATYVKYLLLIAVVVFLVYVVFKMLGIDIGHIFKGQAKKIDIPYAESLENIHEISFDDEIEKAVTNRNYKLAVRLLYLRSLKQLNDAQLIHWRIEKTNTAYVNEITDDEQRQFFSLLTRQFEYVWYGDFFIDNTSFQNINILFQDFKRLLA